MNDTLAAENMRLSEEAARLRDFVTRVARGQVRHPVPEARRILGVPVISNAAYQAGDPPYEPVDAGTQAVTGPIHHHEKDH